MKEPDNHSFSTQKTPQHLHSTPNTTKTIPKPKEKLETRSYFQRNVKRFHNKKDLSRFKDTIFSKW